MREIRFTVDAWPPAKNEAMSMLGPNHSHAVRVRSLLEAARLAMRDGGWQLTVEPVGLELVVYAAEGQDPWDATNYLGGTGDVLQDKSRPLPRLDLSHLGELRQVALYENDRQIREVHYRQALAPTPSYSVRVWTLDPAS
ncbi:MAG: hypothetical protein O2894_12910 [Planctomycetota bacterium]|nr:hypothetical protein [Planctomycetota bacterium]